MFLYKAHTEPSAETTRYSAFRTTPVYCKEKNPFIGQIRKKKEKQTGGGGRSSVLQHLFLLKASQTSEQMVVAWWHASVTCWPTSPKTQGSGAQRLQSWNQTEGHQDAKSQPQCGESEYEAQTFSYSTSPEEEAGFVAHKGHAEKKLGQTGVERPGEQLPAQEDWEHDWELKPIPMLCVGVTMITSGDVAGPPQLPPPSCSRLLLAAQSKRWDRNANPHELLQLQARINAINDA